MIVSEDVNAARALRDRAINLIRTTDQLDTIVREALVLAYSDQLTITYRTPFQRRGASRIRTYHHALEAQRIGKTLPYCLEIWAPHKVLHIEWENEHDIQVLTFSRGEWEKRLG